MTMISRRPTPPPPIQIMLARTGDNKICILLLSFDGEDFTIIFERN
jgi:hypothetical protein